MADEEGPKPPGPDAVATAMALGQQGTLDPRAAAYLEKQGRLIDLQIEEQERENELRHWSLLIRHISDVLKLTLELTIAVIAAAVMIGILAALWAAANDKGVVVEAFKVPPDLAQAGLTGDVVAAKLLDRLSTLQNATNSNRAASSYANNWGSTLKLQIPETGVSIGELNRSLHAWLGNETLISGEIWHTSTGIAVTARAGSAASPSFSGSEANLDKLIQQAAEAVYKATQPYRYAVYLTNSNRNTEAEAAYQDLIANGSQQDQVWAMIGVGNLYTSRAEWERALPYFRKSVALDPNFVLGYTNISSTEGSLQHDEQSLAAMRKVVELTQGAREADISDRAWRLGKLNAQAQLASDLGDFHAQLAFDHQIEALPEFNSIVEGARNSDIGTYGLLHDASAARRSFDELPPTANAQVIINRRGGLLFAEFGLEDWKDVLAGREYFEKAIATFGPIARLIEQRQLWPFYAIVAAHLGDMQQAHSLVDGSPFDCVICLRARGTVRALEKNWDASAWWFARAEAMAPSVPFVDADWGKMLLAKGDYIGAITKFQGALHKGPHFADPMEMWGEALMGEDRSDLALAKFAQAAKYAPNWGRLRLEWGMALLWLGRKNEAHTQFATASGLNLNDSDRAALNRFSAASSK